jgi:hypothetical protein
MDEETKAWKALAWAAEAHDLTGVFKALGNLFSELPNLTDIFEKLEILYYAQGSKKINL